MTDPSALPSFERPPVVETVLSVQFERLRPLRTAHLGVFWSRVRDRFPLTEEHPPLAQVFERFPETISRGVSMQLGAEMVSVPRIWLMSGSEMIQVQADRFIKNWRKVGEKDEYPHYLPVVRPAFERDFGEFKTFVAEQDLGVIRTNQCEVTYVNHILSGSGWDRLEEAERIFTFWKPQPSRFPGKPEDFTAHVRYQITAASGDPIGRLHVDVQPAFRTTDGRPMYVMNLTARGLHGSELEFFDVGREWIVRSFKELTTENMHKIWGIK
jgi:uncharacterized protein (TIGR04255 family)